MTKRFLFGVGACLALAAAAMHAQTPDARPPSPAFEVATIKPAPPITPALIQSGKMHAGLSVDGARVDIGFFSLSDMIRTAFKLKSYQISGPDWLGAQRFDILAKMPEGSNKDQVPEMLQALLAERFKLEFHRETKERSVYALVVGKGGIKMKEAPPDEAAPPPAPEADSKKESGGMTLGTANGQPMRVTTDGKGGATFNGGRGGSTKVTMGPNGAIHMEFEKMPIDGLLEMVARFVDRPVVDMTGLKGKYVVGLDLSMEDMKYMATRAGVAGMMGMPMGGDGGRGASPADAASDPTSSIFNAIQGLGLKLESRKAPVEILVVDKAEKAPTEN